MKLFRISLIVLLGAGWLFAARLWLQPAKVVEKMVVQKASEPARVETPEEQEVDPVSRVVAWWAAKPAFAGASLGVCLLGPDGEKIAAVNDELALVPASALKTVTTATALQLLGPEFRFETSVASTAMMDEHGAVDGELMLIGSGDPTLAVADLEALAEALVKAGVKSVTGGVLGDATLFPEAGASDLWNWGDVGNGYGAGVYGLNVAHNRYTAPFNPGEAVGDPAEFLGSDPELPGLQWENLVTTGPAGSGDGVVIYAGPYSPLVTLRGTVPAGEPGFSVRGAIPDPPAFAAHLLDRALRSRGVALGAAPQTTRRKPRPGALQFLASHRSAALSEIVPHLHVTSDNVEAQCLFLRVGGAREVRDFWARRGVEFAGLRMEDGSGLARANRIRAVDLARVNYLVRHGPAGEVFYESLSVSRDGAAHSKGGAMSGVRSDVGFLTRGDGSELTFAIIANGIARGADFRAFRNALLDVVAGEKPRPAEDPALEAAPAETPLTEGPTTEPPAKESPPTEAPRADPSPTDKAPAETAPPVDAPNTLAE